MLTELPTGWLVIACAAGVILTVVVGSQFARYTLTTPATPNGILDLELAGGVEPATRILTAWRSAGLLDRAAGNLWLDMAWIACYTLMMASGCLLAMHAFTGAPVAIGLLVASAQILAGALDYIENIALLATLRNFRSSAVSLNKWPPRIAGWCARLKLHLLTLGLAYLLLGGLIALLG